jgi:ADP-dependent NAD(P)H-hydrate dehydratase
MIDITAEVLRKMPLPEPGEGDKTARGDVLVIAGSRQVPGAALLSGVAALRAGAGRLRIATCISNAAALAIAVPEAFVLGLSETAAGGIDPSNVDELLRLIDDADCVLVGPGLLDQPAVDALIQAILEQTKPGRSFVFDAVALKAIRDAGVGKAHGHQIILTPHAGEMAGLLECERVSVEADPETFARRAAQTFGATVALKGARTFIAQAQENLGVCRLGNVGLATSGSGDVLAGVIAGLLARGAQPFVAACWGVFLHATAGDRLAEKVGRLGFLARELLPEIPAIMGGAVVTQDLSTSANNAKTPQGIL